jgi:hypothetical protein
LIPNCYSWNRSKSAEEEKNKKPITQSLNEESTIPNNKKKIKLGGDSSSCQKSEKWISKQNMLSSSSSSSSFFFYCKCKEKRVKIMGMGVCVCV